jgi:hypothetical protein
MAEDVMEIAINKAGLYDKECATRICIYMDIKKAMIKLLHCIIMAVMRKELNRLVKNNQNSEI